VEHGEGKPAIRRGDAGQGPNKFEALPWSDWPEAKLIGPLRYARGNNKLDCPEIWKKTFPRPIEIIANRERERKAPFPQEPFLPP